jgi:hypothetical protein
MDDDKKPQLHQIKGSGSIEEKADVCVMLHYPYFYDKSENINELQVIVAKNRYGATGHAKLYVHPQYSRISDDGNIHKNQRTILDVAGADRERCEEDNVHGKPVQCGGSKSISVDDIAWED